MNTMQISREELAVCLISVVVLTVVLLIQLL